jgi:LmbE family N-acetylglucosaminyl deacetylase
MSTKRLLGVFAHPDDEGMIGGALLQYQAAGVETGLVYATHGEAGEIADPKLATRETLGQVREGEMQAAAAALQVPHLWFLDYRDSGMAGTSDNQNPRAFIRANAGPVVGQLVEIIRQFQPQVLITFDEMGGYKHPDHIAIYKYTTIAFHAAADYALYPEFGAPHSVSKLYYASFARRHIIMMDEWLQTQEEENNVFRSLDINQLGLADDQISVTLDVERLNETKARSWSMHKTQKGTTAMMDRMPDELQRKLRNTEYYQLATSRVGPDIVGENDLFARVF